MAFVVSGEQEKLRTETQKEQSNDSRESARIGRLKEGITAQ
jgi:hypothetical protein